MLYLYTAWSLVDNIYYDVILENLAKYICKQLREPEDFNFFSSGDEYLDQFKGLWPIRKAEWNNRTCSIPKLD